MQEKWTYKNYEIEEGLKPGSKTFRYFFKILQNGDKKCNYCVWIADNAIDQFDPSQEFDAVVASQKDVWQEWVKGKIDAGDFRNRALKIEKEGRHEINLSEMSDHIKPD
jgi:putative sterol carrier protein